MEDKSRCIECNAELSCCDPGGLDGPEMDCNVCRLRTERDTLAAERERLAALARRNFERWKTEEIRNGELAAEVEGLKGEQCHHGWRGSKPDGRAGIAQRCPGCGSRSLFIGSGGWITCGVLGCRDLVPWRFFEDKIEAAKARADRMNEALGWVVKFFDPDRVKQPDDGDQFEAMMDDVRAALQSPSNEPTEAPGAGKLIPGGGVLEDAQAAGDEPTGGESDGQV